MPFKHQMERQLTREDLGLDTLEDEPLHVYDLPQIHTKPSAKSLLDTLSLLSVESRSWEVTPPRTPGRTTPRGTSGANTPARQPKRKVRADGVPQYLTKIVSSRLAWIDDDADKEQIWNTASVRLSERSGRTAMGALTRTFPVPLIHDGETGDVTGPASDGSDEGTPQVDISIHEPALTADNLGFKTWAASYVLARNWRNLLHNVPSIELCQYQKHKQPDLMLELGAGTGLVGLAAAAVLGVRILLTDLPLISSNLARNVKDNATSIETAGAGASVAILDWSQPKDVLPVQLEEVNDHKESLHASVKSEQGLDAVVVVAADPIYSMEHPVMLVNAIKQHLSKITEARVIIGIPIREAYVEERALFRKQMGSIGLELAFEEKEIGLDDWGSDDAPNEVECSTTVWKWA
ncbi:hypothetical protein C1H76_7203 [Elsinoe australis]|uniref:Protein-lysine N-methyltransferase rrg1 n=1 Tax=Elsinoe australis TaxID=40998 RepID=A0A4U7AU21_9PEZI|nr:hypothetical protein C1H76_7203 [Elsinoe australis]